MLLFFLPSLVVGVQAAPAAAKAPAGWDRQKAFDYLESRQREWADWKPAQKHGGPCISCHTGLSYLLARRVIGEKQPRPVESALVEGVRTRVLADPPRTMLNDAGAEAILNLLTLSLQRRSTSENQAPPDPAEQLALQRLWANQVQEGDARGSWSWFMHELHPVESEHSTFYAATLAELALSAYPAQQPVRVQAMRDFLDRQSPGQPLHNRLARIAFTAKKDAAAQADVLRDLWKSQSPDGGWTTAALGPWARHGDEAPPDSGSNAYATAWAAYAARQAGVACGEPALQRALAWLVQHQDPASGAWRAISMNKVYAAGSMQSGFMTDAATGYAAAALLSCGKGR